ncbi:hypothetical protein [Roseovarius indicus]|nr:hypothetical protein [Roseovarius indicus]KRS16917.1 hypothetical protein XM52_15135 [Roseovarius indicus]
MFAAFLPFILRTYFPGSRFNSQQEDQEMLKQSNINRQSAPTLITTNALHVGATYRVAADRLNAEGYLPDDDFRLARDVQDDGQRLPDITPDYLRDCHARVTSFRDDLSRPGDPEAQALTSLLAVHGKLVHAASHGPRDQFERLGGLATIEEEMALSFKKTGRADDAAQALIRYAAKSCDKAILTRLHEYFDGLAGPVAATSGQSFSRVVRDLWRNGKIESDDSRRKLNPTFFKTCPLFAVPSGQFLKETSACIRDIMPEVDGARDHPLWGRTAIENDIAEFQAAARQIRNASSPSQSARMKAYAGIMGSVASMTERAGLNLAQSYPTSEKVMALFSLCDSAAGRSHIYQRRARQHQPPSTSCTARH